MTILRSSGDVNPVYNEDSAYFTVTLHHGGVFKNVPTTEYTDGEESKFDYVSCESIDLPFLHNCCKKINLNGDNRFYFKTKYAFVLILSDDDLKQRVGDCLFKRELELFVECEGDHYSTYCETDTGVEDIMVGVEKSFVFNENMCEDYDSAEDESFKLSSEDIEDDDLYNKYVSISTDDELEAEQSEGEVLGSVTITIPMNISTDDESTYNMSSEYSEDDDMFCKAVDLSAEDEDGNFSDDDQSDYSEVDVVTTERRCMINEDERCKSDDETGVTYSIFNNDDKFNPAFELGTVFSNKQEIKTAIQSHAVVTKRSLKIAKSDTGRLHVRCCKEGCPWRMNAIKLKNEETFQIREYNSAHSCGKTFHVKNVKAPWLTERFLHLFKSDPRRNTEGFRLDAIKGLQVDVSKHQAYKAKRLAIDKLEGDPATQYLKLWDYAEELRRTNPGSTILIGTHNSVDGNRFDCMYICFKALKEGFKRGCRPFIGVDGTHLTGPHGGILLTAVSVDASNNIYPIAYAVVEKENYENWSWFLSVLGGDLSLGDGGGYTFMSDKQKGLILAFKEIFPLATHRYCVRHLIRNFYYAGWRGEQYSDAIWNAANKTTVGEFRDAMIELSNITQRGAEWFNDKPPEHWSKSHFGTTPKCDLILNNCSESFNSNILVAREKPILTMLEWVREYLMQRLTTNRDKCKAKWSDAIICPKIEEILNKNAERVSECVPMKCNEVNYQITSLADGSQHCVDLMKWSCTCRNWDLSGIPCKHAITAILHQDKQPINFVSHWYTVDMYKEAYEPVIYGVCGPNIWGISGYIPPLPPNFGRQAGRPKTARRRGPDEPAVIKCKRSARLKKSMKLKRKQKTVKCGQCGQEGHNMITCPANEEQSEGLDGIQSEFEQGESSGVRKRRKRGRKSSKVGRSSSHLQEQAGVEVPAQDAVQVDNNEGVDEIPLESDVEGWVQQLINTPSDIPVPDINTQMSLTVPSVNRGTPKFVRISEFASTINEMNEGRRAKKVKGNAKGKEKAKAKGK